MYKVLVRDRKYNDEVAMFFGCERVYDLTAALANSHTYYIAGNVESVTFDEAKATSASRTAKQVTMTNEIADILQGYLEEMTAAFERMSNEKP